MLRTCTEDDSPAKKEAGERDGAQPATVSGSRSWRSSLAGLSLRKRAAVFDDESTLHTPVAAPKGPYALWDGSGRLVLRP